MVSLSSQSTTQNNQQSVQHHPFNIEQRQEQGAQRERDDTFYADQQFQIDFPCKKIGHFLSEQRGSCRRYLHVIVEPPPLMTSRCLRALPDSSGWLGFQGIFISFNLLLFKEMTCLYGLGFFHEGCLGFLIPYHQVLFST